VLPPSDEGGRLGQTDVEGPSGLTTTLRPPHAVRQRGGRRGSGRRASAAGGGGAPTTDGRGEL